MKTQYNNKYQVIPENYLPVEMKRGVMWDLDGENVGKLALLHLSYMESCINNEENMQACPHVEMTMVSLIHIVIHIKNACSY